MEDEFGPGISWKLFLFLAGTGAVICVGGCVVLWQYYDVPAPGPQSVR